jgi:hypothetical protein
MPRYGAKSYAVGRTSCKADRRCAYEFIRRIYSGLPVSAVAGP